MTERAPRAAVRRLFRSTWWPRLVGATRSEVAGGILLLLAAAAALAWANSPWQRSYAALRDWVPAPWAEPLHLDLSLAAWAADGLLAIFFFVVGLELKREFVAGKLRDPRRATLPVVAALGGMLLPALLFTAVVVAGGGAGLRGWAIPTATDIAFALAVLALVGPHLPQSLRAFLLTLAVVDDLLAIVIIATCYTSELHPASLLAALLPTAAFAALIRCRRAWWWALPPLAATAWALTHASGVHATIAGVLLGFTVPARAGRDGTPGLAERLEHRWRPVSTGVAVPVFAFFAAGVSLRGADLGAVFTDPVVLGVIAGLVLGKAIGIFGSTYLLTRYTRAALAEDITWPDLLGVALLAGIGFTVSLLIGELAFGAGSVADDRVKVAVLGASLLSATLAATVLRRRDAAYRRRTEREAVTVGGAAVPEMHQR
jgi:NhaA family Na+:H+ antiporter